MMGNNRPITLDDSQRTFRNRQGLCAGWRVRLACPGEDAEATSLGVAMKVGVGMPIAVALRRCIQFLPRLNPGVSLEPR